MYQKLKQNQKVIICNCYSEHDGKEAIICGIANDNVDCLIYIVQIVDDNGEYSHRVMHADSLVIDDGVIEHDLQVFRLFNNILDSDKFTLEAAYEDFKNVR